MAQWRSGGGCSPPCTPHARSGHILPEEARWLRVPLQEPSCVTLHPHLSCPLPNSEKLAGIKLDAEEIALTATSQRRKLEVVLAAANRSLQAEGQPVKWSVDGAWASAGLVFGAGPGAWALSRGDSSLTHQAQLRCLGHHLRAWKEAEASGRCKVGTESCSGPRSRRP